MRANRIYLPGMIFHLTHRCHNRSFLLKSACYRSEYRERLRLASKRFKVALLDYSITSNHTHEIAMELREGGISRMMQALEGDFAGSFNRRKHRKGAFWEDRYHCTMIEDGVHLWNGLRYIDLNMVRAGVVAHPSDWQWCGYRELMGERKRYRLLETELLLELLRVPDIKIFREEYEAGIQRDIAAKKLIRERMWTESIAVGSKAYVTRIAAKLRYERLKTFIEEREDGSCAIWESTAPYDVG